ncbi:MAG TPA: hypothetical protein ENJ09_13770 [Planctomycetes bacterium]|nr:hypothetical protein [Planctomycetota bacterium]
MQEIWESIRGWASENLTEFTLTKIYIACAIAGGTVLVGQTGLNLFGLGGDSDIDPDVDVDDLEGGDSLSFLSIRALAGFLTFFGLVGWGGTASGWGAGITIGAAFLAGASVMVFVALMMRFFRRMAMSGTVRPAEAVGLSAQVYLRIPASNSGKGKITVKLQGRSQEFDAVTRGPELPTGSACRIVAMPTEGTFEVEPLE